jgi:hypothetical protein
MKCDKCEFADKCTDHDESTCYETHEDLVKAHPEKEE